MDAIKYLRERRRMTDHCTIRCNDCPLKNNGKNENCDEFESNYPEEAVEIIEKWAAEHPVKTRQSEFLKMFPNAEINYSTDTITIRPCVLDKNLIKLCKAPNEKKCSDCRRDYWLAETAGYSPPCRPDGVR